MITSSPGRTNVIAPTVASRPAASASMPRAPTQARASTALDATVRYARRIPRGGFSRCTPVPTTPTATPSARQPSRRAPTLPGPSIRDTGATLAAHAHGPAHVVERAPHQPVRLVAQDRPEHAVAQGEVPDGGLAVRVPRRDGLHLRRVRAQGRRHAVEHRRRVD